MTDIAQLGLEIRSDGVVVASKRLKDLETQSGKATRASDQLLQRAKRLSSEMNRLGRTLSTSLTLPLIGAAGASIKLATDFDSSLTTINTLVGVSREEVAGFRQEILNMAAGVGRGPTELANGLFAITSAGMRGSAALETLEASAKASAIGLGDTRSIALASVAAVTAYGEANLSAAESVEILVGTIEQGNLEAGELSTVIGRVIPVANELGVSFADVGTFIAAFSRLGINAAQSTTALNATLNGLLKPSEDTRKAFLEMGFSIEQFRSQIEADGFISAMQNLVTRSREMGVDIARIVPSTEALSGVLGVFGNEANDVQALLAGVSGAVGTLEDRFQAVIDQDPAAAFNMMKAELEALSIEISANLMPAWLELLEGVRDVAIQFRNLDADTQALIVKSGLLAAALGPVLIVLGSIVNTLRILIPLLAATGPAGFGVLAVSAGAFIGTRVHEALEKAKNEAKGLNEQLRELTPEMSRFNQEVAQQRADFLTSQLQEVDQEISKLMSLQQELRVQRQESMGNALMQTDADLSNIKQSISELIEKEKELQEQLEINAQRLKTYNERQNEGFLATDNLTTATESLTTANEFLSAIGIDVNKIVSENTQKFKEQEAAMRLAKEQADSFMEGIKDLRAELDGPSAVAIREFTLAMDQLSAIEGLSPDQIAFAVQTLVDKLNEGIAGPDVEKSFEEVAADGIASGISRAFQAMSAGDLSGVSFGDIGGAIGRNIFGEVGRSLGQEFLAEPLQGMGETLGNALGDTVGEKMGDALGESMGKAFGAAGEVIGQLLGQFIFDKIFPEKEPKFQVGGAVGFGATGAGRIGFDLSSATPFGDLFVRTRKMEADAQDQLRNALISFDTTIAGIITDEGQMQRITTALSQWGFDTQDEGMTLQRVLESRFQAIVSTFDQFGQDMINSGATLQEQIANMLDLLVIRARNAIGDSLGEGMTSDEQVFLAMELARAGESMGDSFQRLLTITGSINQALDLTGNTMDGGSAAVVRFGDALQRAFGDDLQRLTDGLGTIFETFFTEEERLEQQIASNRGSARNLLESLGLEVTDEMLSESGFRKIFDELFGALSPEDTAVLVEAGVLISDLIDSEEKLAEARGESNAAAKTAAEIARERESLELRELRLLGDTQEIRRLELDALDESNRAILERIFLLEDEAAEQERQAELGRVMANVTDELLELISPTTAAFARLTNSFGEQIQRAQELGASEEQLGQIRALQQLQIQRFVADLSISILRLKDDLFGTTDQFESVGDTIGNAADSIERTVVRALESIDEWLARSNLSNVSPLTPEARLESAESDFMSAFDRAMGGDLEALQSLPRLADSFLDEASGFFGTSNQEFVDIFNSVREMMEQAAGIRPEDIKPPTFDQVNNLIGAVGGVNTSVNSTTSKLGDLERELKAFDISDQIGALARATGDTPSEIAKALGFSSQNMRDVLELLGVDIPELTGEELEAKFNNVVGAIGATNTLLGTVGNSLTALDTLSTIASITGQVPSDIATALGFSGESMLQILRNLGVDIPEGTEEELKQYFNNIVGEINTGNGKIKDLNDLAFLMERNLWAIGDVLVQILTELGGVFVQPDFDAGISAEFEKSNSGLIGLLESANFHLDDINDSVSWNTRTLERNLWAIGDVLVQILTELGGVFVPPNFEQRSLISPFDNVKTQPDFGTQSANSFTSARSLESDQETKKLLERIDNRLRENNSIQREGFGAVVSEERSTRNILRRPTETART